MNDVKSTKFLDTFRGIAAIYVLLHHARWLLTENFSNRQRLQFNHSSLEKYVAYFFSIFRFGHEMVILFFVLSGFVIHFSVLKTLERNKTIKWKTYIIKRANRIYPPFLLALFLTGLVDFIGYKICGFSFYKTGSSYFSLVINSENTSITNFLGNIINLQNLVFGVMPFGSNKALWSLGYEWWFYLLYPFFYWVHTRNFTLAIVIQVLLFLLFQVFLPNFYLPVLSAIFQKMIIWWMGVLLAELFYRNKFGTLKLMSCLLLIIPIALLFFEHSLWSDLLWGIGFVGLLALCLQAKPDSFLILKLNSSHNLGKGSYTLYLIHSPVLIFIHGYLIHIYHGKLPDSYCLMLLVPLGIIFFARWVSRWIEKVRLS